MIRKNFFSAAVALALCFSGSALAVSPQVHEPDIPGTRYFSFVMSGTARRDPHEFIFKTADPVLQNKILSILGGTPTREQRVRGKVVPGRADYNEAWPFHLDPDSIELFGFDVEVCDADTMEIEEHLSEVGGSFLPGNVWCAWSSRLVREVKM